MRLCRYWAAAEDTATDKKGRVMKLRKWGGSNDNRDAALREARAALERLKERIIQHDIRLDGYGYSLRDTRSLLHRAMEQRCWMTTRALRATAADALC